MKRMFCLLVLLLTLTGCGGEARETQAAVEASLTPPTEPAGSYAPDSPVELLTGGDVRAYPQSIPDIYAIACAGEDLLVFSGLGSTTVTRLTGENLYRIAEATLDCTVYPDAVSTQITGDRLIYYDYGTRELVFLDESFREFYRVELPSDILGEPAISADREKVYFFLEAGLRVLDVETGIARTLTEMAFPYQEVIGLLMEDRVVECSILDAGDALRTLYIDTQSGEVLQESDSTMLVSSWGDRFYGAYSQDGMDTVLFGQAGERIQTLLFQPEIAHILPRKNGVVTETSMEDGWKLDYYDLTSGLRCYTVQLPEEASGWSVTAAWEHERLYYYTCGEAESQIIYRWDMDKSPAYDETVYTGIWYTQDEPDTEGLAACQAKAEALGQRYGLDIRVWERAVEVQPWDYEIGAEYRVPVIEKGLDKLERILQTFPEGFFTQTMETLDGGTLRLCLVGSLAGSAVNGSLANANGVQFWDGSDSYIAVALGSQFEQTLFHELFHVMETRILSRSIVYYRWDELNPAGFTYDYDYAANQSRDALAYIEDETTRAFIDSYCMSFPKEDRARTFEYACMEGNESYFISATMQKKLRTLCEGIRDAYGLKRHPEAFLWEQYLESPLA